jgi:hypothetical protein
MTPLAHVVVGRARLGVKAILGCSEVLILP